MPKPSAALTRFSPDPNMPADVLFHPESVPHLPSSASVLTPTPPTSHCDSARRKRWAYRSNRRLPLRRIDRRAVRSRPGAPICWGREAELVGWGQLGPVGALRWGREGRGDRCGSGGRRRGAEERGGRALADGGWKGRLLLWPVVSWESETEGSSPSQGEGEGPKATGAWNGGTRSAALLGFSRRRNGEGFPPVDKAIFRRLRRVSWSATCSVSQTMMIPYLPPNPPNRMASRDRMPITAYNTTGAPAHAEPSLSFRCMMLPGRRGSQDGEPTCCWHAVTPTPSMCSMRFSF